jgi:hypothetical protein
LLKYSGDIRPENTFAFVKVSGFWHLQDRSKEKHYKLFIALTHGKSAFRFPRSRLE